MKRLWPLPVLLLLALPMRAQEGEEEPAADQATSEEAAPAEQPLAPPEGEGASQDSAPPDEPQADAPPAEANAAEGSQPQDGAAGDEAEPAEKAPKEEPLISVKMASPDGSEMEEESVAPAIPKKKVVPTATLMKAPKKGRPAASKNAKDRKASKPLKTSTPTMKKKAQGPAPEPPPPPVPAVPLTPIPPRNP